MAVGSGLVVALFRHMLLYLHLLSIYLAGMEPGGCINISLCAGIVSLFCLLAPAGNHSGTPVFFLADAPARYNAWDEFVFIAL